LLTILNVRRRRERERERERDLELDFNRTLPCSPYCKVKRTKVRLERGREREMLIPVLTLNSKFNPKSNPRSNLID
jgi:hypothetical protein